MSLYSELNLGTRGRMSSLTIREDESNSCLFFAQFFNETYASLLERVKIILNTFGFEGYLPIHLSRTGAGAVFADFLEADGYNVVNP